MCFERFIDYILACSLNIVDLHSSGTSRTRGRLVFCPPSDHQHVRRAPGLSLGRARAANLGMNRRNLTQYGKARELKFFQFCPEALTIFPSSPRVSNQHLILYHLVDYGKETCLWSGGLGEP